MSEIKFQDNTGSGATPQQTVEDMTRTAVRRDIVKPVASSGIDRVMQAAERAAAGTPDSASEHRVVTVPATGSAKSVSEKRAATVPATGSAKSVSEKRAATVPATGSAKSASEKRAATVPATGSTKSASEKRAATVPATGSTKSVSADSTVNSMAGAATPQPVVLTVSQQQKLMQEMELLRRKLEREQSERKQLEEELAQRNQKEREHLEEEARMELERRDSKEVSTTNKVAISNWFLTICYLNIPIVNIIYFLITLIRRKTPQPKKAYVVAWAVFQILCLALAALLIYFIVQFGADLIDNLLKYLPK